MWNSGCQVINVLVMHVDGLLTVGTFTTVWPVFYCTVDKLLAYSLRNQDASACFMGQPSLLIAIASVLLQISGETWLEQWKLSTGRRVWTGTVVTDTKRRKKEEQPELIGAPAETLLPPVCPITKLWLFYWFKQSLKVFTPHCHYNILCTRSCSLSPG